MVVVNRVVCNLTFFFPVTSPASSAPSSYTDFNSLHMYLTERFSGLLLRWVSLLFRTPPPILSPLPLHTIFPANLFTVGLKNHSSPVPVASKSFLISSVLVSSKWSVLFVSMRFSYLPRIIYKKWCLFSSCYLCLPLGHDVCIPKTVTIRSLH